MLYSCTRTATAGVKGLTLLLELDVNQVSVGKTQTTRQYLEHLGLTSLLSIHHDVKHSLMRLSSHLHQITTFVPLNTPTTDSHVTSKRHRREDSRDRWTERRTERRTVRRTDGRTDRQTYRQAGRQKIGKRNGGGHIEHCNLS